MKVRITSTIAQEYEARCAEYIPDRLSEAGTYELTAAEAAEVLADAKFNSDRKSQDVGPYGMPLAVFNAYRALAKQFDA